MSLTNKIDAFVKLGQILKSIQSDENESNEDNISVYNAINKLVISIKEGYLHNGWFTEKMVNYMIGSIAESLERKKLLKWLEPYSTLIERQKEKETKTIAIVMAGNIPAVGFHDLLAVLISGNKCMVKLSTEDNKLLPSIFELLCAIEPGFNGKVEFVSGKLEGFDAVIATGSNNTSRYFDYYFGKYPHIIRKNRNGVAVLSGNESKHELEQLADDIFLYYGLGCRNVSKLFLPENYDFNRLLEVLSERDDIAKNHKYFNNYEYNKALYLINGTPHFDSGNLILVQNDAYASPVSVVFYEFYSDVTILKNRFDLDLDKIQCVVSDKTVVDNSVLFGKSQQPELWDYADGINTIDFILTLND